MSERYTWLLQGPDWMQYRVRIDLLGCPATSPEASTARTALLRDPQVLALQRDLECWPGTPVSNHKSAGLLLHKLVFLADLGLQASDPGVSGLVEKILQTAACEGPFQVMINIPRHFGGRGVDEWSWMLCDTPLLLYALSRFGLGKEPPVLRAAGYLSRLQRRNGWPCAAAPEAGSFRGPGRAGDPCPYANLLMLQALACLPEFAGSEAARLGAEAALQLWGQRQNTHPYLFRMGTDFCKLKAPLIWYDILHVVDVLVQFPWLKTDPRLLEMVKLITEKADDDGKYTPESVWTAWKDWEFGQKKQPSRWLTFLVERIRFRFNHDRPT